jgi:hypothetical protein
MRESFDHLLGLQKKGQKPMTSGKRQSRRRFLQGSAALAPSLALAHAQAEETAREPP